jgi:hypothetical protein
MAKKTVTIGWLSVAAAAVFLSLTGYLTGCGGDTGGGEASYDGTSFVDTDAAAGTITMRILEDRLPVSGTTKFVVTVRDMNEVPVPNVEIACDTETGVALIEPSTGYELTDSYGGISGVLGCALVGSYRVGCRLPVGGGKRVFKTMHCAGPVPEGFTGFPGAGGGNLGTGSTPSGDASPTGTDEGSVAITGVEAYDSGTNTEGSGTLTIDVVQSTCSGGTSEPFFDSVLGIQVTNSSSVDINFTTFQYSVDNSNGLGDPANSPVLSLSNAGDVTAKGGTKNYLGLFLKASNGKKYFSGSSEAIPAGLGFRNVTIRLHGTTSSGEAVTLTTRVGLSFDNYNHCGS